MLKSSPNPHLISPHDPGSEERLTNPEIYMDTSIVKSEPVEDSWETFIHEDEDPLQFDSDAFVKNVVINPEKVKRKRGRPPKTKVSQPKPKPPIIPGKRTPGRPRKVIKDEIDKNYEINEESCPASSNEDGNSSQNRIRACRVVKRVKVYDSSEVHIFMQFT